MGELSLVRDNLVLRLEGSHGVIGKEQGPGMQTLLRPYVSRRHLAWRRLDDESVEVEDLGSTNGTFVRGRQLAAREPTRLMLGGRIDLGKEGDWVLTDSPGRYTTYATAAPCARIDRLPHGAARVTVTVGSDTVCTITRQQARLVLYLADEVPGLLSPEGAALSGTVGWVLRSEVAEGFYADPTDVMKLNNVLDRLRRKCDEHDLPTLVETQPGGGRPGPDEESSGGLIRIRLDGAWVFKGG